MELAERFPANGQDLFNYLSGYLGCNHEIHCILILDSHIDYSLLQKASALLLKSEPILGCRFIENHPQPYWITRHDLERLNICSLLEPYNTDAALRRFINAPVDSYHDPMLQIKVFRTPSLDTLCLKINHACCDAGGLKEVTSQLASLYNQLLTDRSYIPLSKPPGKRDSTQILETVNLAALKQAWKLSAPVQSSRLSPTKKFQNLIPQYIIKKIDRPIFEKLAAYAHSKGVTINDLLLTSLYRTLFALLEMTDEIPMSINVTVDLRRYMPLRKAQAACNLSGLVTPALSRRMQEDFSETLIRVAQAMNTFKQYAPGVPSSILTEVYAKLGYTAFSHWVCNGTDLSTAPIFSNIGVISEELLRFGKAKATEGYMVGPAMPSPSSLLAASTYNKVLTLAMAFYAPAIPPEQVELFLTHFVNELPL